MIKIKLGTLIDPKTKQPLEIEVSKETYDLVTQPLPETVKKASATFKRERKIPKLHNQGNLRKNEN